MDPKTSATSLFRQTGPSVDPVGFGPNAPSSASIPLSPIPAIPSASDSPHDDNPDEVHRYRTIWLSDIHLGSNGCQASYLLDFLRHNESDTLYLVGDIIDGWQLKKSWYWPQSHNDVVQKILRKARKGTKVFLIAGNHDEFLRPFGRQEFGRITITSEVIHQTADGRRLLVLHGDQFDQVIQF